MTTKSQALAALKSKYPTLRIGDDEQGYTDLSPADYEATIEVWADNQLADEAKEEQAKQSATNKAALLAKLGISADEAKLLLG